MNIVEIMFLKSVCEDNIKILEELGVKEEFMKEVDKVIESIDTNELDKKALETLTPEELKEVKRNSYLLSLTRKMFISSTLETFILNAFPFDETESGPLFWCKVTHNFCIKHPAKGK